MCTIYMDFTKFININLFKTLIDSFLMIQNKNKTKNNYKMLIINTKYVFISHACEFATLISFY